MIKLETNDIFRKAISISPFPYLSVLILHNNSTTPYYVSNTPCVCPSCQICRTDPSIIFAKTSNYGDHTPGQ